jgi:uncharacterized damage-inducible protein DinB
MQPTMEWFQRKFEFDLPIWMFPNVVERLRGTPSRIEELVRGIKPEVSTRREGDRWSIQENAGHLLDLEPLWAGRMQDFLAGLGELRAADLKNTKTHEADHNASSLQKILSEFRSARTALVEQLDALDEETAARTALHPRLQQPMRVIDSTFFVAEHDDHHLARITELMGKFS